MNKRMWMTVGVVVGVGVVFFAGIKYGGRGNPRALSPDQVAQRFQNGTGRTDMMGNRGAGFVVGEILSRDNTGATLKLPNGGSKIIIIPTTVAVTKLASGSFNDLGVGKTITINGTTNTDGSVTAQSIQLR